MTITIPHHTLLTLGHHLFKDIIDPFPLVQDIKPFTNKLLKMLKLHQLLKELLRMILQKRILIKSDFAILQQQGSHKTATK
jgi:hypothetical protein